MKRIFPTERVICGTLAFILTTFFFVVFFSHEGFSFDSGTVFSCVFFLFCFLGSLHFMLSHTAYNTTHIISQSLFRRKKIHFEDITQICRTWEGTGKGTRLRWYLFSCNARQNKETRTTLYLPENYESRGIQNLIEAINRKNEKCDFIIAMR